MSISAAIVPLLMIVGVVAAATLAVLLLGKVFKGVAWVVGRVFRFVYQEVSDVFQLVGCCIAAGIFLPLTGLQTLLGRWSAAQHYGRALESEMTSAAKAIYRIGLGNPLRFIGMHALLDGVESRVPDVVAHSPGYDRPPRKAGGKTAFPGYQILGSLPSGGSGAKLYVAAPDHTKRAAFAALGAPTVGHVVLKTFSLRDGSALPQIVRESRALEAAKRLGLVLDHDLNEDRFYYAMPYVPGDDLRTMTSRMHAASGPAGLARPELDMTLAWMADLLLTLDRYHQGGLWHKDVKPENIVVSEGRAHLVDLGLVTPLRSAMTLTTHGTEYFRDPEMVRMAMRGAKVHEVSGVKFDLYGAGAVMFAALENSFPAHGGLSTITKQCPEALRWIVRRAMADMTGRYNSAQEMLGDVRSVMAAEDPYAMRPADLPSVSRAAAPVVGPIAPPLPPVSPEVVGGIAAAAPAAAAAASPLGGAAGAAAGAAVGVAHAAGAAAAGVAGAVTRMPWRKGTSAVVTGVHGVGSRVHDRFRKRREARHERRAAKKERRRTSRPNAGVFTAVFLILLSIGGFAAFSVRGGISHFENESLYAYNDMSQRVEGPSYTSVALEEHGRPYLFSKVEYWPSWPERFTGFGSDMHTGRVLVVEPPTPTARYSDHLPNLYKRLEKNGFDLLGGVNGNLRGTELAARVITELDSMTPAGQASALSLREFFDDKGEGVDAVLWICRPDTKREDLRAYVAFRDGYDPANLVDNLQARL